MLEGGINNKMGRESNPIDNGFIVGIATNNAEPSVNTCNMLMNTIQYSLRDSIDGVFSIFTKYHRQMTEYTLYPGKRKLSVINRLMESGIDIAEEIFGKITEELPIISYVYKAGNLAVGIYRDLTNAYIPDAVYVAPFIVKVFLFEKIKTRQIRFYLNERDAYNQKKGLLIRQDEERAVRADALQIRCESLGETRPPYINIVRERILSTEDFYDIQKIMQSCRNVVINNARGIRYPSSIWQPPSPLYLSINSIEKVKDDIENVFGVMLRSPVSQNNEVKPYEIYGGFRLS